MAIWIDPKTGQRVVYDEYSGDLQYDLKNGSAISTQVIGIIAPSRNQQMNLGRSNTLFGTDAAIMGKRLPDLGITGENIQTTNRVKVSRRVNVNGNNWFNIKRIYNRS